jgi:hypothetical protein
MLLFCKKILTFIIELKRKHFTLFDFECHILYEKNTDFAHLRTNKSIPPLGVIQNQ